VAERSFYARASEGSRLACSTPRSPLGIAWRGIIRGRWRSS